MDDYAIVALSFVTLKKKILKHCIQASKVDMQN